MKKNIVHPFDKQELITIFEAARIALADGEVFDILAEDMDVGDKYMIALREKLQNYMDSEDSDMENT